MSTYGPTANNHRHTDHEDSRHRPQIIKRTPLLTRIDRSEEAQVLRNTEFHGLGCDGRVLNPEFLFNTGMGPSYRIELGGRRIYFASQVYPFESRQAIIAFVEDKSPDNHSRFVARTFYRSNSQGGSWRYLPSTSRLHKRTGWFSKGYDQNSLSLPAELFAAISEIKINSGPALSISESDRLLLFSGTNRPAYKESKADLNYGLTYYAEMSKNPVELDRPLIRSLSKEGFSLSARNTNILPNLTQCTAAFPVEYPLFKNLIPDYFVYRKGGDLPEQSRLYRRGELKRVSDYEVDLSLTNGVQLSFSTRINGTFSVSSISQGRRTLFVPRRSLNSINTPDKWQDFDNITLRFDHQNRIAGIKLLNNDEYEFMYSVVNVRRFSSLGPINDQGDKLEYLIHSDSSENLVMFGSVTIPSELTSLGLYSKWVKSNYLLVPWWEYRGTIPNRAGSNRIQNGHYEFVSGDYHDLIPFFGEVAQKIKQSHNRLDRIFVEKA
jgi:hypothetical protein